MPPFKGVTPLWTVYQEDGTVNLLLVEKILKISGDRIIHIKNEKHYVSNCGEIRLLDPPGVQISSISKKQDGAMASQNQILSISYN